MSRYTQWIGPAEIDIDVSDSNNNVPLTMAQTWENRWDKCADEYRFRSGSVSARRWQRAGLRRADKRVIHYCHCYSTVHTNWLLHSGGWCNQRKRTRQRRQQLYFRQCGRNKLCKYCTNPPSVGPIEFALGKNNCFYHLPRQFQWQSQFPSSNYTLVAMCFETIMISLAAAAAPLEKMSGKCWLHRPHLVQK